MKITKVFQLLTVLSIILISGCKKDDNNNSNPSPTTSNTPGSNATEVGRNTDVTFTFTEAMNAATINNTTFTLDDGTTPVAGTVSYDATSKVATFSPTNVLAANTQYTATLNGVQTSAGGTFPNTEWSFTTGGSSSILAPIDLGTAGNYVILAKSAVANTPTSAITGNVGISPAALSYATGFSETAATGYATSAQVTGVIHAANMAAPTPTLMTTAINNMVTAYNDGAGRTSPDFKELATGNIGGRTLTSGLYKWSNSVTMSDHVTISGSATDVWIFQIAGNLTQSSAKIITLTGGALAENIFWVVAGSATIGTSAQFKGIILSKTSVVLQTSAVMNGRALAQTQVVLDKNTLTQP